jgi:hypothetical protein
VIIPAINWEIVTETGALSKRVAARRDPKYQAIEKRGHWLDGADKDGTL